MQHPCHATMDIYFTYLTALLRRAHKSSTAASFYADRATYISSNESEWYIN